MCSEEQKRDCKETFDLYDKAMTGFLPAKDAKEIIGAFGFIVTDSEIGGIVKDSKVSYKDFFDFYVNKMKQPKNDNLDKAFEGLLSKKTGKISAEKFKHYLMNFGMKFSENEANDVLEQFQTDFDGNINYKDFIKQMTSQ